MKSRTESSTRSRRARFARVVARALARPLSSFRPMPVRSQPKSRAKSDHENTYFPVEEADA